MVSVNWLRILFVTIGICLATPNHSQAHKLLPHSTIIGKSFNKETDLPALQDHSYQLLDQKTFHEPYHPSYHITPIAFDEEAALNIPLSGLTKTLGGFSEVFLKEQGVLENAYLAFQAGDYQTSEQKLLSLLPSENALGERATLLLGWIKYKTERFDAALIHAKAGFDAGQKPIALESFYLAFLILMKSQAWGQIISLYQDQSHARGSSFWDARLTLIQLTALASLERWKAIGELIRELDLRRYAHTRSFYKFYEMAGIAYFKQNLYTKSLEHLKTAQTLNPDLEYQKKLNRIVAWQYYFLRQYAFSVEFVEKFQPFDLIKRSEEMKYLKLACLVKLGRWQQVKEIFGTINLSSVFYHYAAFAIQIQSDKTEIDPELRHAVQEVHYDFPEMKFRTALQKGNQAFRNRNYEKAEMLYLQALAADVHGSDYDLAQYNLGLTHLKLNRFAKAKVGFENLSHSISQKKADHLTYHLLFALYRLQQKQAFLDRFDDLNLNHLSQKQRYELKLMLGQVLLASERYQEASELFFELWRQTKRLPAFEYGIAALYRSKAFAALLELLLNHPSHRSETLFVLEIKALLGMQQYRQALVRINNTTYQSSQVTELQLEVCLLNGLYQKVIERVAQLLKQSLEGRKRFLYYLSLGEAHFHLKQYTASKNQFYKALLLSNASSQRSLIQYNLAVVAYFAKDYPSFVNETKQVLAETMLPTEVRYRLTLLLVDYHQQQQQYDKADHILISYSARHAYRRTDIELRRILLFHQSQQPDQCFKLAQAAAPQENADQRRDRLRLLGICGIEIQQESVVIDTLETELALEQSYRQQELELILAQAYFGSGAYQKVQQLTQRLVKTDRNRDIADRARLLHVDSLLQLKEFTAADRSLGNLNHFRQTDFYAKALTLKAEINAMLGKVDDAVKALLRIYYLPDSKEAEKQAILTRTCEILLKNDRHSEALKHWQRIDPTKLKEGSPVYQRYQALKKALQPLLP